MHWQSRVDSRDRGLKACVAHRDDAIYPKAHRLMLRARAIISVCMHTSTLWRMTRTEQITVRSMHVRVRKGVVPLREVGFNVEQPVILYRTLLLT